MVGVAECGDRIHIWSLKTYDAHPLARHPLLRPNGTDSDVYMTGLCIAHELFALVEWSDNVSVTVWNWQTGTLIVVSSSPPPIP